MHLSRILVSTALLPLAVLPVRAIQLPLAGPSSLRSYTHPEEVIVGRVNRDAEADLVACFQSAVHLFAGEGDATFASTTLISGLDSCHELAIGDIDGDGDGDVLVGQYYNIAFPDPPYPPEDAELVWLRNPEVGGGEWVAYGIAYLTTDGVSQIALADLDRDGDLDVVATTGSDTAGNVYWWSNDGTPTSFWARHTVATDLLDPWGLEVADLDQDGDLDLALADYDDDRLVWFENDGVPSDGWSSHDVDVTLDGPNHVVAGDVDRDGAPDLVASGRLSGKLYWYERSGAAWTRYFVADFPGASEIRLIDLDHDGDLDLLGQSWDSDFVNWYDNADGAGGFWIERTLTTTLPEPTSIGAGDLDRDGDVDLFAGTFDLNALVWWENRSIHRRFQAGEPLVIRSELADPRSVTLADLNRDGWLDVATTLWDGDAIQAFLAVEPLSGLWWNDEVAAPGSFDGARAVTTTDLDRDGDVDVLGAAVFADDIAWWESDGDWDPVWTHHPVLSTFNGAHRTAPADFDRDGDIDLAVAGYDGDQVRLEINANGHGTTWTDSLLHSINGPFELKAGDLDRDGKPDLATGGYDADAIHVLLNDPAGDGEWVADTVASGIDGPRGIDLCDLDHDGDLDIVALVRLSNQIRWYANDGTGLGWTGHDVGSGYFEDGANLRCADLDADGDADVAAAGTAGDDVWVWLNAGSGLAWTRLTMEQSLDSPWDVELGDLDRDGRVDVVAAAGGTADRLVWYRNIGAQYVCTATDTAPRLIVENEMKAVLDFIVMHNGWATDPSLRLKRIRLAFSTADGTPLTTAQLAALTPWLRVYQDTDRDAYFDPAADTQVAANTTMTLSGGDLLWNLPTWGAPGEVPAATAWRYFLVMQAQPDSGPQAPNQIVIAMPADGCVATHDDLDYTVAIGEPRGAVATDPIWFGANLFADGFESEDFSRWNVCVTP